MNITLKKSFTFAILAILVIAPSLKADSLLLKNGSILEGNIISKTDDSVTVKVGETELKIPLSSIDSKIEESDQQYHTRMARSFYDKRNFDQCIAHLEILQKTGDSRILSIAIDEVKNIHKNFKEDGEEGIKRCTENLTTLKAASEFQKAGKYREALESLGDFMRLTNKAAENASIDLVLEAAELAEKALAQRLEISAEKLEQLNNKANNFDGIKDATYNIDPEGWKTIKPLKTAEQLWVPLDHMEQLPDSVVTLQKMYRDQEEIRILILAGDLLGRMKLSDNEVIHDPIVRQWYYVCKIIKQNYAANKASRNALAKEETTLILNALADEWEANRTNELQRLANKIREMVKAEQWGYDMRFQIKRFRFLKPGPDLLEEIIGYHNTNELKIIEIVAHMRKVNKSNSNRTSYWDNFTKGQAVVGRIGSKKILNH